MKRIKMGKVNENEVRLRQKGVTLHLHYVTLRNVTYIFFVLYIILSCLKVTRSFCVGEGVR